MPWKSITVSGQGACGEVAAHRGDVGLDVLEDREGLVPDAGHADPTAALMRAALRPPIRPNTAPRSTELEPV